MRQTDIIDGSGYVEAIKMLVASDSPGKNVDGRARYALGCTNADDNGLQIRT